MLFRIPATGQNFEIPDYWWLFAEMSSFSPSPGGYFPYRDDGSQIEIVPLNEIQPPIRSAGIALFKKYKLLPVLFAFKSPECELPPVRLAILGANDSPFGYTVQNGFHRYYASIAAGYSALPAIVVSNSI